MAYSAKCLAGPCTCNLLCWFLDAPTECRTRRSSRLPYTLQFWILSVPSLAWIFTELELLRTLLNTF